MGRNGRWLLAMPCLAALAAAETGGAGCSPRDRSVPDADRAPAAASLDAVSTLAAVRALAPSALPARSTVLFDTRDDGFRARFDGAPRLPLRTTLPKSSAGPFVVRDNASGATARFYLTSAAEEVGAVTEGVVVYPRGGPAGSDVLVVVAADRVEDFVFFRERPPQERLTYELEVPTSTGLRLVAGVLEVVDAAGAPRLRVEPPCVRGASGARAAARLAVEGCAVDTSPVAPWDRAVTAPGSATCSVVVDFTDAGIEYPLLVDPAWSATTSGLSAPRSHLAGASFSVLSKALLLVTGGYDSNGDASNRAELYDPITQTFTVTGNLVGARAAHTVTPIPGVTPQFLIVGGNLKDGLPQPVATLEIYDQLTGTFTGAGTLSTPRHSHSATALQDNLGQSKVLIAGGVTTLGQHTKSAELFDVVTRTLTPVGSLTNARAHHAAVYLDPGHVTTAELLGRVLVTGGTVFGNSLFSTELFDPVTSLFLPPESVPNITMLAKRARAYHTATLLDDGRVLLAGGRTADVDGTVLGDAEIFGPTGFTGVLTNLGQQRSEHTVSRLPNGDLVFVGGLDASGPTAKTTIYVPSTGLIAANSPDLATPRAAHVAGEASLGISGVARGVLVAGGQGSDGKLASAELLGRPNGETCADNTECSSGFCATELNDPEAPGSGTTSICCNEPCDELCRTCVGATPGTCDFFTMNVSLGWQCKTTSEVGAPAGSSDPCGEGAGGSSGGEGGGDVGPNYVEFQLECQPGGAIAPADIGVCNPNQCDCATNRCSTTCPCAASGFCDDTPQLPPAGTSLSDCSQIQPAVGVCFKKLDDGALCDHCYECHSDNCVDGVCCATRCGLGLPDGQKAVQCQACNVLPGTCTVVGNDQQPQQPYGFRPACDTDGTNCGGTCKGAMSTCVYDGAEIVGCQPQTCACDVADCTVTSYSCNGKGACVGTEKKCKGLICDGVDCKQDGCTSHADCIAGYLCNFTSKACFKLSDVTCDGEHTLVDVDGSKADCAPYECSESTCRKTCGSIDDCVSPAVCSPDGKCVPRVQVPKLEPGGCSATAASGREDSSGSLATLLALFGAAAFIRRRS